ncbi:MAG: MFS transporter [Chloroflexi bacterium]|nr:MFS transporter [Chloroflexota bacterium]
MAPIETPETPETSYRALLAIPRLGRVIVSMQLARVAQSMVGVALVLFVLQTYRSPGLAGLVTFASVFPGLLMAPLAGALLDRHGRTRLIILDYLIALAALVLIGVLATLDALPAPLLVAIAVLSSITGILSHTGLRSLFPILVPRHLWERVNAVDSNGYVVATILGPPIAATLVTVLGGPIALIVIAAAFGLAAVTLIGAPDPVSGQASSGSLLRDAWAGLRYTLGNPTLRGLGLAIATLNLSGGMTTIVVPLIVLDRLHAGETAVGLVFAASGITGMASAFYFGRTDTRGREWIMLVVPMLLMAPSFAILLVAAQAPVAIVGLVLMAVTLGLYGLLNGPLDIALFTVRQRRTEPDWMGRAFAVSMALNFMGFPVGAALAGVLAATSIELAVLMGVLAAALAALFAAVFIPRRESREDAGRAGESQLGEAV